MVLQTWFGEAGAQLAAGRVNEAATAYDNAALAAQEAKNLVLAVEAFRMGAFCHARLGERDSVIERRINEAREVCKGIVDRMVRASAILAAVADVERGYAEVLQERRVV